MGGDYQNRTIYFFARGIMEVHGEQSAGKTTDRRLNAMNEQFTAVEV
jgi:hypothetical protein